MTAGTALATNQEVSLDPSIWVLSPQGFEKLYGVWLWCAHDETTFKSLFLEKGKTSMLAACHSGLREHDLLSWWEHLDCYEAFDTVPAARASLLRLCFLFQRTVMWKMSSLLCPTVSHCTAFSELYFQHLLVYGDHLALSTETSSHAFTERGQGFNG